MINILHREKWYWHDMNTDIGNLIKSSKYCNKPYKFKKFTKKIKIILDNGSHYRYIADLWYLNQDIRDIQDIIMYWILLLSSINSIMVIY